MVSILTIDDAIILEMFRSRFRPEHSIFCILTLRSEIQAPALLYEKFKTEIFMIYEINLENNC